MSSIWKVSVCSGENSTCLIDGSSGQLILSRRRRLRGRDMKVQAICKHQSSTSRTIDGLIGEKADEQEKTDIARRIDHHLAMTMLKLTDCSITTHRQRSIYT